MVERESERILKKIIFHTRDWNVSCCFGSISSNLKRWRGLWSLKCTGFSLPSSLSK